MWIEARLARLADAFWNVQPHGPAPYPRDLAAAASLALPVCIYSMPDLCIGSVKRWLRTRGSFDPVDVHERRLRGCLLAYGGHGFVFVDSADPEEEQRFSIAHEIAHFLLDYQEPRKRAIEALGYEIVPVLDGLRPPTLAERLNSILVQTPFGVHLNLLERAGAGMYTGSATLQSEEQADRLAYELLAPASDVWAAISAQGTSTSHAVSSLTTLALQQERAAELISGSYGLPREQANWYAGWLLKKKRGSSGVREWLGFVE